MKKLEPIMLAGWSGLLSSAVALMDVVYMKSQDFDFVLSFLGARTWPGKIGLALSLFTLFLLFFTQLYFLA